MGQFSMEIPGLPGSHLSGNQHTRLVLNGIDLAGNRMIEAPKFSMSAAADYTVPLGASTELTFHGDMVHKSSQFFTAYNDDVFPFSLGRTPGFEEYNARIGVSFDDGKYELGLWGKNLSDNKTLVGVGIATNTFLADMQNLLPSQSIVGIYGMTNKPRVRNISDLAQIAGVSPATVSRALSGAGLISQKTRERIQMLAHDHNFRPNLMARGLRIQRTQAIGVVLPLGHEAGQHLSDPFFMSLLGPLADALTEQGYDLLLSRVIPTNGEWLDTLIGSGRVDGVIVIGQSNQIEVIERAAQHFQPIVVWGAEVPGMCHTTIGSDNVAGGYLAARHLIGQGRTRLAFFGNPNVPEVAARYRGVQEAADDAKADVDVRLLSVHLTSEEAFQDIADFLGACDAPDGIVAASDVIAMSTLRALAEHGLDVPGDVAVIGYDDVMFAMHTTPPLTTIRQDIERGVALLVDLLLRRMAGEETQSVSLPPTLVQRGSA